jgi:hypothetical protein
LGYPINSGDLILDTDGSIFGIGTVLSRIQDGEERELAYGSRRLSSTQQNYCTTQRELLAVVEFTTHFSQYLLGRQFIVRTDHSSQKANCRVGSRRMGSITSRSYIVQDDNIKILTSCPGGPAARLSPALHRTVYGTKKCSVTSAPSIDDYSVEATSMELRSVGVGEYPSLQPALPGASGAAFNVESGHRDNEDDMSDVDKIRITDASNIVLFHGWATEELCQAQMADSDMGPINRWLEEGQERL